MSFSKKQNKMPPKPPSVIQLTNKMTKFFKKEKSKYYPTNRFSSEQHLEWKATLQTRNCKVKSVIILPNGKRSHLHHLLALTQVFVLSKTTDTNLRLVVYSHSFMVLNKLAYNRHNLCETQNIYQVIPSLGLWCRKNRAGTSASDGRRSDYGPTFGFAFGTQVESGHGECLRPKPANCISIHGIAMFML